jgi:hypothetical protein
MGDAERNARCKRHLPSDIERLAENQIPAESPLAASASALR